MKKPLKKKDMMRISSSSFLERSIPCGKRRENPNGRVTPESTKEVKDKTQVVCYECKKLGHFKFECPNLENEKEKSLFKKKKGLMTTWVNLDLPSSKEEDEEANICRMAYLLQKKKMAKIDLKKKFSMLSKDFDALQKENRKENESLKEEKTKDLSTVNTPEVNEQLQEKVINLGQSKIAGINKIDKHNFPSTDNVLFVEGLKHILFNISELCDSKYDVSFNKGECTVQNLDGSLLFFVKKQNNLYKNNLTDLTNQSVTYLVSINNDKRSLYMQA
ncbi:hypothetical protein CR513_40878, partial [Mucuna pruriens]